MNKKNVFISAIESGLSLSKRFLFCLTVGLGILLAVLGLGGFIAACLAHKAQSISLYLYFLLLFYFGLFISYRGWVGQKAMKPIKTNQTDNEWVAVRAYPTTFWSYIRRAFFNPRDMGIGAGIVIFYGCFILILLLDDDVKTPIHSVLILLFILFFLWELVVLAIHRKFWKTVWNEGPLMIRLNDEGLSFIMPYNMSEEGEVILVGDDRFDSWDDSNHCLVTDHMDWKDIRRVDFFRTYLKLSTFWRSYTVFYNDSDLKDNGSLLRQISALNFLRHQENTQKVTINTINHLFTGLERLAISMNSTDKGEMIVGDSKFGGEPDVAKEFTWPTTDDNRPLSFVFQVRRDTLKIGGSNKATTTTLESYIQTVLAMTCIPLMTTIRWSGLLSRMRSGCYLKQRSRCQTIGMYASKRKTLKRIPINGWQTCFAMVTIRKRYKTTGEGACLVMPVFIMNRLTVVADCFFSK